jgi:hypothetical protein
MAFGLKEGSLMIFYKIVSNGVFFSFIFKVMIEGIIEILICSYFNYKYQKFNSVGEILGAVQSYFCLTLVIVAMPLINIFLLIKAFKDIKVLDKKIYK